VPGNSRNVIFSRCGQPPLGEGQEKSETAFVNGLALAHLTHLARRRVSNRTLGVRGVGSPEFTGLTGPGLAKGLPPAPYSLYGGGTVHRSSRVFSGPSRGRSPPQVEAGPLSGVRGSDNCAGSGSVASGAIASAEAAVRLEVSSALRVGRRKAEKPGAPAASPDHPEWGSGPSGGSGPPTRARGIWPEADMNHEGRIWQ
jgi:hypothetical protein